MRRRRPAVERPPENENAARERGSAVKNHSKPQHTFAGVYDAEEEEMIRKQFNIPKTT